MIRKQNEALTSKLALAVCKAAETKWFEATEAGAREELEDTVCFMLIAFTTGLIGEKVPLLSVEGLLTFWEESRAGEDCHIMLTLKGRFKGKVDKRLLDGEGIAPQGQSSPPAKGVALPVQEGSLPEV